MQQKTKNNRNQGSNAKKKIFFGFISKSPTQMGSLSAKNASKKFSRLGTFKYGVISPKFTVFGQKLVQDISSENHHLICRSQKVLILWVFPYVKYGVRSPKFICMGSCVHCTAVLIGWDPSTPSPLPPYLGSYTRALLVSQERRHIFVTLDT